MQYITSDASFCHVEIRHIVSDHVASSHITHLVYRLIIIKSQHRTAHLKALDLLLMHFNAGSTAVNDNTHTLTVKSACALSSVGVDPMLKTVVDQIRNKTRSLI